MGTVVWGASLTYQWLSSRVGDVHVTGSGDLPNQGMLWLICTGAAADRQPEVQEGASSECLGNALGSEARRAGQTEEISRRGRRLWWTAWRAGGDNDKQKKKMMKDMKN